MEFPAPKRPKRSILVAIMSDVGEVYILGIDEAGRGPVLGPMVYGTCYCPLSKKDALKKLGFADSKTLTEQQREKLFELIKQTDFLGWMVDVISPQDLSAKMLRRSKYNLNAISHDSAIGLIQAVLDKGVNVKEVYVDTVGKEDRYQEKLSELFPNIKFTVTKKADSLFPIVSAASICAKVTRDHELTNWKFEEKAAGLEVSTKMGSGYPGDEKTKTWLKKHMDPLFGWPSIVRFSWGTCKELIDSDCTRVVWDDDEEEKDKENTKMTAYWTSASSNPAFEPPPLNVPSKDSFKRGKGGKGKADGKDSKKAGGKGKAAPKATGMAALDFSSPPPKKKAPEPSSASASSSSSSSSPAAASNSSASAMDIDDDDFGGGGGSGGSSSQNSDGGFGSPSSSSSQSKSSSGGSSNSSASQSVAQASQIPIKSRYNYFVNRNLQVATFL